MFSDEGSRVVAREIDDQGDIEGEEAFDGCDDDVGETDRPLIDGEGIVREKAIGDCDDRSGDSSDSTVRGVGDVEGDMKDPKDFLALGRSSLMNPLSLN